jgi:hypothetical protein
MHSRLRSALPGLRNALAILELHPSLITYQLFAKSTGKDVVLVTLLLRRDRG